MIELTSNGHLSKIKFISTTSIEYNFVVVDDGMILYLKNRNTSTKYFFNNPDFHVAGVEGLIFEIRTELSKGWDVFGYIINRNGIQYLMLSKQHHLLCTNENVVY